MQQSTMPKKLAELNAKMKAIGKKAPILTGKDNMVELER